MKFFKNNKIATATMVSVVLSTTLLYSVDSSINLISSHLNISRSNNYAAFFVIFLFTEIAMLFFILTTRQISSNANNYGNNIKGEKKDKDNHTTNYIVVTNSLNSKLEILESRSLLIYWTMIFVIVSGVILILFSGYLSSLDSYASSLWVLVENSDPTQKSEYRLAEAPAILSSNATSALQDHDLMIKNLTASYIASKEKLLTAMIENLKNRSENGHYINIGGMVLRVSILGMLIFLVQILVQLYRYNYRLIAFYTSRRDGVLLGRGDLEPSVSYCELLLPKGVDFGKEPTHPFAEAAQLVKGKVGLARTNTRAEELDSEGATEVAAPGETVSADTANRKRSSARPGRSASPSPRI